MERIHLMSKVDAEGKLMIQLPQDFANEEVDLVILRLSNHLENAKETKPETTAEELGYPPDFFEKTAGVIQDETLVRGDQGECDVRRWDLL